MLDGVFALAAVAVAFGIVVRFGGSLPSQVVRTMHVGFLCLVAGAMLANHRAERPAMRPLGWVIGLVGFAVGLYHWALYNDLVNRAGDLTQADMVVGIAALVILIYLVWRVMGRPCRSWPAPSWPTACSATCCRAPRPSRLRRSSR